MEKCANETNESGKFFCKAANYDKCGGEKCPFYINCKDAKESLDKANERLNSFTMAEQRGIADKYYNGKMPWKK